LIHAAVGAGITFMDNAWEYHDGKSEERVGKALAGRRDEIVLATKFHGRMGDGPPVRTSPAGPDHLDLWRVHEVATITSQAHLHEGALGALRNRQTARKVRFVSFTGHKTRPASSHADVRLRLTRPAAAQL
jgi:aryl-alcohol dehydrogenase-like predicted oxidoreductase